jgi:hypothetical protein
MKDPKVYYEVLDAQYVQHTSEGNSGLGKMMKN